MKTSAGIRLFRRVPDLEVLVGHPGGPFWAAKDDGAWSVIKGESNPDEDLLAAAVREFAEEVGGEVDPSDCVELGSVQLRSGKLVVAWAAEGEFDPERAVYGTFEMEWPRGSGRLRTFPEIDRAAWFDPGTAKRKLNPAQGVFVDRLVEVLGAHS